MYLYIINYGNIMCYGFMGNEIRDHWEGAYFFTYFFFVTANRLNRIRVTPVRRALSAGQGY